ncbi:MAG: hypothetical protein ABIO70_27340 [Pseudomonadota bacterium]
MRIARYAVAVAALALTSCEREDTGSPPAPPAMPEDVAASLDPLAPGFMELVDPRQLYMDAMTYPVALTASVAVGPDGAPVMVYQDYLASRLDSGHWYIEAAPSVGWGRADFDPQGRLHVFDGEAHHWREGGAWHEQEILAESDQYSTADSDFEIDPDGGLHVLRGRSSLAFGSSVIYAYLPPGSDTWQVETLAEHEEWTDGSFGENVDLFIDRDGVPVVVYQELDQPDPMSPNRFGSIVVARRADGGWEEWLRTEPPEEFEMPGKGTWGAYESGYRLTACEAPDRTVHLAYAAYHGFTDGYEWTGEWLWDTWEVTAPGQATETDFIQPADHEEELIWHFITERQVSRPVYLLCDDDGDVHFVALANHREEHLEPYTIEAMTLTHEPTTGQVWMAALTGAYHLFVVSLGGAEEFTDLEKAGLWQ